MVVGLVGGTVEVAESQQAACSDITLIRFNTSSARECITRSCPEPCGPLEWTAC